MSTAASAFILPDFVGQGLWTGVQTLFSNFWPALALALGLLLFSGFGGLQVGLIRDGLANVRGMGGGG